MLVTLFYVSRYVSNTSENFQLLSNSHHNKMN
nr:MAG TPA: hypothetical protein [Caudoviricetes sp.]